MKKRLLLSVFSELKGYDHSDRPNYLYLEVTQKMANEILNISKLIREHQLETITTKKIADRADWGVIDEPKFYDSIKMAAFELKQASHKVESPAMVITEEGFYFRESAPKNKEFSFRTDIVDFESLNDSKSIVK